jgi:hypothetical protein
MKGIDKLPEWAQLLVGQVLWGAHLAADMLVLQLGDRRLEVTWSGKEVEVGALALHIQSAWRFRRTDGGIVAGSADEGIDGVLEVCRADPRVVAVECDECGGLSVEFEHALRLDVFPATASEDEYTEFWRMLVMKDARQWHVVVGPADGITIS